MPAFLKKYLRLQLEKKILFLLGYSNYQVVINTVTPFFMDEKLFELFCIENDFAKYFAIAVTSQ